MRLRWFVRAILFSLVCFFVAHSFSPSAKAATSAPTQLNIHVGTHLIQGDPGGQLKVLDVLKQQNLGDQYPVVMMLDAENPNAFTTLAQALSGSQFAPIIRVNIKADTDPGKMAAVSSFINSNLPGAPVEVGNEINNQDPANGEWKSASYSNYAALFNALAVGLDSSHPLGISAMDTINSVYNAEPILGQILSSGVNKSRITAVFANVYDVGSCGYDPRRCNVQGGDWVLEQFKKYGINLTSDNLYLTEFGTTKCSDLDCLQKFYKDNSDLPAKLKVGFSRSPGQQTGTNWIHTIPTVCAYIPFDNLGNLEHPTACGGAAGGVFIYPGIEDQPTSPEQLKLASQYMLTCGPKLAFAGKIQNEDLINNTNPGFTAYPLDCSTPGSCTIPQVSGFAYINHEQTTIPLFRLQGAQVPNTTTVSRRLDDLEGFFSARNNSTNIYDNFVGNGAGIKNLTPETQCTNTLKFLEAVGNLCASSFSPTKAVNNPELASPTPVASGVPKPRCALDLSLSGSSETYLDVLREKPNNFSCFAPANPDSLEAEYKTKLALVETTTPRAFKPAYIVHYVNAPQNDPTIIDKLANWLAPEGTSTQEKLNNRVKVTKVYVPANFASASDDSLSIPGTTGSVSFNSGFTNSMTSVLTPETITQISDKLSQRSEDVFSKSSASNMTNPDPFLDKFLSCPECDQESFVSILVKRINAEVERAHDDDETNLDCQSAEIAGEKAAAKKQTINPDGTLDPVREISMPARATLKAKASVGPELAMRTYMLLPQEYARVNEYEKSFAGAFLDQQTTDSIQFTDNKVTQASGTQPSYKYLQLSDTAPKFNEPGLTVHMSTPEKKGQVIGFTKDGPVSLVGTIDSADTSTFDVNPLVPGGRLARSLWEYICHVVQPPTDKTYAPYQGLEKLLSTGRSACFTTTSATQPPASNLFTQLSEYFKSLLDIGARYPLMPQAPKTCGFAYVTKDQAQKYASELPKFVEALKKGFVGRGMAAENAAPPFNNCGGKNCAEFMADVTTQVAVCNGSLYVNPYYALLIALHEYSPSTVKPDGTGYWFGCQPYAFSQFNPGATYQGLACQKAMDPKTNASAISPIIRPQSLTDLLTTEALNACAPDTTTPLGQSIRQNLTFEDGMACFMGRMQNFCELSVSAGTTADFYSEYRYSYKSNGAGTFNDTELESTFADYAQLAKEGGFTPSFNGRCSQ